MALMTQVKTFRIFVSSTFSDLKEERNALQKRVFPKLRKLCMQYGCRFQAIDLRWGIREEAALDQQTVKICLEEINRCQRVTPRPNFIVLLGDRYGWCPVPYEIVAEEFEKILKNVSNATEKELLTHWYRRDDNAMPPVYCLQHRTGEFVDSIKWEPVEHKLRSILLEATKELPLEADKQLKYTASATEQEIVQGALCVQDASEHVFCFFRSIRVPQKDGFSPIKDAPLDQSFVDFADLDAEGNLDHKTYAQLNDLKERLSKLLPGNIHNCEAKWTGSGITTDHIDKLCKDVYDSLSRIILGQIAQLEEVDPLEREIFDHEAFGKDRAKFFTGRTAILQTVADYIKEANSRPLAVFGASGSGKTALIAKAVEQARNEHPDAEVIFRFIGATPSSSDGRALLESLCRQSCRRYGADESTVPTDYRKLVQVFLEWLALATKGKPLILFLDALDQLSDTDHARNLSWLPAELPEHVRLIVSTLPGECLSVLEKKLLKANLVEIEPMPLNEGSELLGFWFKDAGRILQDHQRDEVLNKFASCGLPLYLKLAFEEACRWKSYTEKTELSSDIPGVIRDLFARLSLDANHGKIMVSRSLGYLAAAKNGLSEDELLDILSFDKEVLQNFIQRAYHEPPEKRLPVVVWSRLYFDLEPYLTERTADGTILMTFYHRQFAEVVAEEFLAVKVKRKRHERLARYFDSQPLWIEKDGKKTTNLRKVSELPYQQTYGKLWDEIEQTLCDLHFIEAKCAAGMTYDLIEDYAAALDSIPEVQEEKQKERKHEELIRKYTENLIAYARGEIPSLEIIPSVKPWSNEEIRKDTQRIINNPTQLDRMRAFSQFVNSESHVLVKFGAMPGFYLQQAYNSASSGPVAKAAENIINAGVDSVLFLHHPSRRQDYNPHPALLKTIEGHTEWVNSVCVTPDGRTAVSGSNDKTLRVWDLETGECFAIYYQVDEVVSSLLKVKVSGHFVCGTGFGEVILFKSLNLPMELHIATPIRIWLYGKDRDDGHWDDEITAVCQWCDKRFLVADKILDVIMAIARDANLSPDQFPCLELPKEAWNEPKLLSECPLCHKPLKFNPFIVDNREHY